MKTDHFFLLIFLTAWYFLSFSFFIEKNEQVGDSPELRARFGTILWHSSDKNGKTGQAIYDPNSTAHTYCYYPKSSTVYSNKRGEYIIKREDQGDCNGWFGQAIFYEGSWVSEREKIWWSKDQKLEEELAKNQEKPTTL